MRTTVAISLINIEFSKLLGFKASIGRDYNYLALGVKLGKITPLEAAQKVNDLIKF